MREAPSIESSVLPFRCPRLPCQVKQAKTGPGKPWVQTLRRQEKRGRRLGNRFDRKDDRTKDCSGLLRPWQQHKREEYPAGERSRPFENERRSKRNPRNPL